MAATKAEWNRLHPAQVAAISQRSRMRTKLHHPDRYERILARQRLWNQTHLDYRKAYYRKHHIAIKAQQKLYRESHREEIRAKARARYYELKAMQ